MAPSADYLISFGIIVPIVVSLKLEYTQEGLSSVANFTTTYEESQ